MGWKLLLRIKKLPFCVSRVRLWYCDPFRASLPPQIRNLCCPSRHDDVPCGNHFPPRASFYPLFLRGTHCHGVLCRDDPFFLYRIRAIPCSPVIAVKTKFRHEGLGVEMFERKESREDGNKGKATLFYSNKLAQ